MYLTDVTFCREGNPSHRASPLNNNKKLLNFNKYYKLARIVQGEVISADLRVEELTASNKKTCSGFKFRTTSRPFRKYRTFLMRHLRIPNEVEIFRTCIAAGTLSLGLPFVLELI